ncbi:MAG TPA: YifB family Mg chelatase-like AAA ATPase, partial [Gammaproteobacteria bacterium]|nr:YifB family Mg chelatase-like AAA ATPase [Gammaproteobacteria bacterium]
VLSAVLAAQKAGRRLIIPKANAAEAALAKNEMVFSAASLIEVCSYLTDQTKLSLCTQNDFSIATSSSIDLADVKGQAQAKRSLEIAAAGKHSMLLVGPPGTGKTMLASRLPTLLPPLSDEQALEVATVASANSCFNPEKWQQIPFRSPHHSASTAALVGGGRPPRPGEISLAHHGVLFLDELPEFSRQVLESLREPLESGFITISRAAFQTIFPAQFQLVAAMNPCPCGYAGDIYHECRCSSEYIQRYRAKLSGPLLDRIDMHLEVPAMPADMLLTESINEESSVTVRKRVDVARLLQLKRQDKPNAELNARELNEVCHINGEAKKILQNIMTKFRFSARVYHRILKVALTIADLKGSEIIRAEDISEALLYRCLDKQKKLL